MKLKNLLKLVGADDQIIALIVNDQWAGAFPVLFCPKEYDEYIVESIMPEDFKGESPFDGLVLKVWLTEEGHA